MRRVTVIGARGYTGAALLPLLLQAETPTTSNSTAMIPGKFLTNTLPRYGRETEGTMITVCTRSKNCRKTGPGPPSRPTLQAAKSFDSRRGCG